MRRRVKLHLMSDEPSPFPATTAPPRETGRRDPGRTWWLAAAGLITASAVHFTLVALWLLPGGATPQPLRLAAQAWVAPLFVQSWWLFAPDPPSLERVAEVRGLDGDGGTTEWLSLTGDTVEAVRASRLSPRDAEWIVVLNATYALADPLSPAVRLQGAARELVLRAWRAPRHQPAALIVLERAGTALLRARGPEHVPEQIQVRVRFRQLPDTGAPATERGWNEVEFLPVPFVRDVARPSLGP